jgi:hypothetical protein
MAEVALLPSFNGSANLKGTGQGDPDLFGRRPGFESRHLSFGMETAQKDGELVPPQTRHQIALAHRLPKTPGGFPKNLISRRVSPKLNLPTAKAGGFRC